MRALYLKGDSLLRTSSMDQTDFFDEFLMTADELRMIGKFPFTVIFSEYNELISKGSLSTEYSDVCCKIHMIYGFPCRHLLLQRLKDERIPLITLDDVPIRWHRGTCNGVIPQTESTLVKEKFAPSNPESSWGYSSCVHKFDQYFSVADRDPRIQDILDNALEELSSIQHQNDTGEEILPPNNLLIPGAPHTKPPNNVDGGIKKKSSMAEHQRLKDNIHVRFVIQPDIRLKDAVLIQIFDFKI